MKKSIVKYYSIHSDKMGQPASKLRIVFISDMHNVVFGRKNELLLEKIDALKPDLVLLGGDTIVAKPGHAMDAGLSFIKALGRRHQVYAGNGNHEYRMKIYPEVYGEMYRHYRQCIQDGGVILLENKKVDLVLGGMHIGIHGLELEREYYARLQRRALSLDKLHEYLGQLEDETFHILLAHNPCYGKTYMEWGADLTLSGHYHGGIVRFGDRPLIGNDFKFSPMYGYGHYEEHGKHLITSGGLGEHTIPLRIHNPRELVVIDIRKKEDRR
jgi:predicted MPP superfamily phosphohydrolase